MLPLTRIISVGVLTLGMTIAPHFALAVDIHPGESHDHDAAQPAETTHHNEDVHHGDESHHDEDAQDIMKNMREMHKGHHHEHDFKAMEKLSPEQLQRTMNLMQDIGISIPLMNPANGRKLFTNTGCVVCHSINGVGGAIGPSLNAADMPDKMNAFEFAARMWRGAAAMTALQEDMIGGVINLTGQELADLIAFAHDEEEQKKLTEDQIPEKFHKLMSQQ